MTSLDAQLKESLIAQVKEALNEDIQTGDITAQLIPEENTFSATVISREKAVLCGIPWVNEVFQQLDQSVSLEWHFSEGDELAPNTPFLTLSGNARSILTGERTALNFLQTLSYTATVSRQYSMLVEGQKLSILDTRKTIPGFRLAQKYAVKVGGASNHRVGLYDAFLIKENHIMAAGSIGNAIAKAAQIAPGKTIEVETESLDEVRQAVHAGADIIMLDNFSLEDMKQAVETYKGQVRFEASGNMTNEHIQAVAATGVDYISVGALTKHVQAIDLSLRVSKEPA
ncbi:carboxylating nicotinate-nucleotide diphosphorylase [Marinomonas mediterranea]|jgi:nicotinate-nucleotide pyrophosphorylase [carboxylating] (EC 2.4.2.19)|uniref:Probable nicotinate-nucleotide pyrophosphorylase [carboxylating] n=1 Tax=Marinomonas mediterranea (strain ATCC 700492 / JCM 21426 / NBRC 103028 / MMB-1) TaxID=717774 RepID=F2K3E5_MARM1|nr:carboxylating nicotinate-nucleotide diphosphorylase [Marinomonas mediterranea]ADZ91287.1 nicotinate-nucleotide pyrophosphorylase [Marinomonas mediterranea MMB-1]WCN09258.1 carboxylating nicotinate-nucleotide diphosphorylase [Marinomonas mediterranea]WCN13340.1 carboxylating nicotinate-nucleotide diphosphorylase [Marinomonas mediterranea]WCN17408.1 carboxylating nicotinate-nucleotide diphosphorylase [Marinomonas mediterranea MMB-1]